MTNSTNDLGRTAGAWTLEYDGSLVMAGQIIGIGVEGFGPDHAGLAEKKANARLMSAAPDLYAAWVAFLAAQEDKDIDAECLAFEAANAALAKARGG